MFSYSLNEKIVCLWEVRTTTEAGSIESQGDDTTNNILLTKINEIYIYFVKNSYYMINW